MKVEVKILLQISMNSINNSWDSIKLTFVSVPKVRKKMKEKSKQEKKHENEYIKGKHTNIYPYVYIHTPMGIQIYIHTDTQMQIYKLFII